MFNAKKRNKEREEEFFKGHFAIKLSDMPEEVQEDFKKNFKRIATY